MEIQAIINKLQKFLLIFILVHENFSFVKDQLVKEANPKFCFDHFAGGGGGGGEGEGGGGGGNDCDNSTSLTF